ncbi:MAG: M23 family metallopeptidase [Anaerolineae bacterium]|nr:M23 family metallopeptidase [Anaerolineae bacterium]
MSFHPGIDLSAKIHDPIFSSMPMAQFIDVRRNDQYGLHIIIGIGADREVIYGHLQDVFVTAKQPVLCGQVIGLAGASGKVTGPHLHFEIRIAGKAMSAEKTLVAVAEAQDLVKVISDPSQSFRDDARQAMAQQQ